MAIIPIIFFAFIAAFGFGFGGSSSEAYSSSLEISPDAPAASAMPVDPAQVQLPPKLVRQMFEYREELQPCGTVTRGGGDDVWVCLQRAADAGDGAELVVASATREGAAIKRYYRVSHDQLEVFTDNHRDHLRGDPAWTYVSCLLPADVRQGCSG